ncbi:hypothetical protein [Aquimarina sediminis]|uniref:hypothetical protein n=1 Tax=Aquimarina sediminis TaxID=2070536 RepID=UPI0019D426C3|nr:hypothetical protein [Aquimarina sediminis]
MDRLDVYFGSAKVFNIELIEALAPLVPFEEFVIGMFLILGIFTKEVLIATITLFTFFMLFFLDVNYWFLASIYCILSFVAIVLLKNSHYDINSMSYNKEPYRVIK